MRVRVRQRDVVSHGRHSAACGCPYHSLSSRLPKRVSRAWRSCFTLLALPFGVLSRLPGRLFFEQRQDLARPDELCLGLLEVLFADSRLATAPAGWRAAVPGARRRVITAALLLFRAVPITPIFLAAAPTPPQTVGRGFRARPPAAPPPSGHSAVP